MRDLHQYLKNKTINYDKLIDYGFTNINNTYIYKAQIFDNQFEIIVSISDKNIISKLIDTSNGDEYVLVDVYKSVGEFVGKVREEYDNKIQDIINNCTSPNIFKSKQSNDVISYIKKKYDDDLEFLWEKFENDAICRNKYNNKWYCALLTVSESKLGIDSDRTIEVLDLKYQKGEVDSIVDNIKIFPGYHMNKKSWITIKMDYSMENELLFNYIDNSYNQSLGNKTVKKTKNQ